MGPVEAEITARLAAALAPVALIVSNDSASHHGHAGDDGSGESHFSVTVTSAAFVGRLGRDGAPGIRAGSIRRMLLAFIAPASDASFTRCSIDSYNRRFESTSRFKMP